MNAELQRQHEEHQARRARFWPAAQAARTAPAAIKPAIVAQEDAPALAVPTVLLDEKAQAEAVLASAGPTVRGIVSATAAWFDVPPWLVMSSSHRPEASKPRQVAMAIACARSGMSLPDIGQRFGGRHHSTVVHSVKKADRAAVAAISTLLDEVRS